MQAIVLSYTYLSTVRRALYYTLGLWIPVYTAGVSLSTSSYQGIYNERCFLIPPSHEPSSFLKFLATRRSSFLPYHMDENCL